MLRLLFTGAGASCFDALPSLEMGREVALVIIQLSSYREVILVPRHGIFPSESQVHSDVMNQDFGFHEKA